MTAFPNSAYARDVAFHLHPQTNLELHEQIGPTVIETGEGSGVVDLEGRRYIDGVSGLWCATLGFSDEALVEAAVQQLRKLPYYQTFAHKSHNPAIDLSEQLIARAPVPMSKQSSPRRVPRRMRPAIKLAWYYHAGRGEPGRRKILARRRAYHGSTIVTR